MTKQEKIELLRLLLNFIKDYDIKIDSDETLDCILYELVQEIIR